MFNIVTKYIQKRRCGTNYMHDLPQGRVHSDEYVFSKEIIVD